MVTTHPDARGSEQPAASTSPPAAEAPGDRWRQRAFEGSSLERAAATRRPDVSGAGAGPILARAISGALLAGDERAQRSTRRRARAPRGGARDRTPPPDLDAP